MIVGTAGHIDHGKTTLVKALTGVDTDRLPEEKRRGISIELGYAFLDVPCDASPLEAFGVASPRVSTDPGAERIGFIDVPGHERLVHTMIAGATGIDCALLLVAADDGVMPQTREHLAVLSLLGIRAGAVVITKCDRVDAARLATVRADAGALLKGTPLEATPTFAVSALHGQGIDELKHWLFECARVARMAGDAASAFRLAIDRAFVLDGVGTVVTGSVHAGAVRIGDELEIVPSARPLHARVRSLHAQNRAVERAGAGQRCAVALAGVAKDDIARGQWLVAPEAALSTDRIDAAITLWQGVARALRSGAPVHVHVGACEAPGTVALLDEGAALQPGAVARVQLVLHRPVAAWRGDRVVLRDAAASHTLAGGRVLDPFAPARYRRTPQRMAVLDACAQPTPQKRWSAMLAVATNGLDVARWARAEGLRSDATPRLPADALCARVDGAPAWALAAPCAEAAATSTCDALRDYHARHTEELGPDAARLRRLAVSKLPDALWRELLAALVAQRRVMQRGAFVHLPAHGVRLSAAEERIAQKVAVPLQRAGHEGAWVRDLARDVQESEALMRTTLARLAQRGELHQVVKDLFYPPGTMVRLATIVRTLGARHNHEVTAAAFRDAAHMGRKRAIQVLEYFDRVGLLRRSGDVHKLRTDTDLFKEAV